MRSWMVLRLATAGGTQRHTRYILYRYLEVSSKDPGMEKLEEGNVVRDSPAGDKGEVCNPTDSRWSGPLPERQVSPATGGHKQAKFIKGPIPLAWIEVAAKLPGKVLHVALAIRYLAGMNKLNPFRLSSSTLMVFGVSRQAAYRGLKALEMAGLITVERHPGKNPVITVKELT